jgi:hypothetical protein
MSHEWLLNELNVLRKVLHETVTDPLKDVALHQYEKLRGDAFLEFGTKCYWENQDRISDAVRNANYLEQVSTFPMQLQYVPRKYRTLQIYKAAIATDPYNFIDMSAQETCPEIRMYALKVSGLLLKHLSYNTYKDECLLAVRQNGLALQYVPDRLMEYEICLEAVKQNGKSLEHVPHSFIDYKMCLQAVIQNPEAINNVPKRLLKSVLNAPNVHTHLAPGKQYCKVGNIWCETKVV